MYRKNRAALPSDIQRIVYVAKRGGAESLNKIDTRLDSDLHIRLLVLCSDEVYTKCLLGRDYGVYDVINRCLPSPTHSAGGATRRRSRFEIESKETRARAVRRQKKGVNQNSI